MADKNAYQAILRAKIIGAIAEARAVASLTHSGVKGSVLEILVSRLFQPLLPSDVGVGTGQIIELHSGRLSPQIDIVLYDKSIIPPMMFDEKLGIFPIEAVLYAIEVKTTVDIKAIKQAHQSAKQLAGFSFMKAKDTERLGHVVNVLFGLQSNLKVSRDQEVRRYKKHYSEQGEDPHIAAICIAGAGYWYAKDTHWNEIVSEDEYDEILNLIGGVTNTYKKVAKSRGTLTLGRYITNEKHNIPRLEL